MPLVRIRHVCSPDAAAAGEIRAYLLCSDGLSAVVPGEEIRRVLAAPGEPDRAVREPVALADGSGGPENVSCVTRRRRRRVTPSPPCPAHLRLRAAVPRP
ncbi:hypothetical protein STENM36S_03930 [Streptomyces tendae]